MFELPLATGGSSVRVAPADLPASDIIEYLVAVAMLRSRAFPILDVNQQNENLSAKVLDLAGQTQTALLELEATLSAGQVVAITRAQCY